MVHMVFWNLLKKFHTSRDMQQTVVNDFMFTEELDYKSIFVELAADDNPAEIAVYVNGECKGASVVLDSVVHICAYICDEPENAELEIVKSYVGRNADTISSFKRITTKSISQNFASSLRIKTSDEAYFLTEREGTEYTNIAPAKKALTLMNYPNPFNPSTSISFDMPNEGDAKLEVYNVRGQRVATVFSGHADAGTSTCTWHGVDDTGRPVGSGVYFYRVSTAKASVTKKMLLLK